MSFKKVEFEKSGTKKEHFPADGLPEIAVVGRSNVGKSSLINLITQRSRLAKVSKTPGRTQLVNFFLVEDRMRIVDLPGYGFAQVPDEIRATWDRMMSSYIVNRPQIKGIILLLDIRRDPSNEDIAMWQWLHELRIPVLFILTKCDKFGKSANYKRRAAIAKSLGISPKQFIETSALNKVGIREVYEAINELVPGDAGDPSVI